MAYDAFRVTEDGSRATIAIDAPPANVLGMGDITDLMAALRGVDATERKAIVLTSATDGLFSGGVAVEDHLGELLTPMMRRFGELFETMRGLETPIVASVNGDALGGGCELIAGCDVAIAAEGTTFSQPEINLGSFPPLAAALYPDLIGEKAAFELVLSGEGISATRARDLGLINRVVPPAELSAVTDETVASFEEKSGLVLGEAKQAFYRACNQPTFAEALAVATAAAIEITGTEEGIEGLEAFMEKREPEWAY